MKLSELRRSRLRDWLDTHPTPAREKSYFSQLVNGTASFGEKAARRIEEQYGMEYGYLDRAESASTSTRDQTFPAPASEELAAATPVDTIMQLLPRLTETQKTEIAATMQAMADKNDRLLRELLARDQKAPPQ